MLQFLLVISFLLRVSLSHLSGHGHETVVYGGDAEFRCALSNPTGVLQVTWQRLYQDNSLENLATYSKRFGQQVNEPYRGKVLFTEASLNSTSITLKNVTWEDESCYICAFNAYPDGSKRKQMCLRVKGLSSVTMSHHVMGSGHDEKQQQHRDVMFSCSATGRPAPTISWDYSAGARVFEEEPATTETNRDQTFTRTHNVTLRVPADWRGRVDCLLNNGTDTGDKRSVHLSLQEEDKEGKRESVVWVTSAIVISLIFVSFIIGVALCKRSKGSTNNLKAKFTRAPSAV